MKKYFFYVAVLGITALLSGCGGMGTSTSATGLPTTTGSNTVAAGTTGTAASSLLTNVLTGSGKNVMGTLLSSLLGNTTTQNSIVGTWTYSQPKVTFESESILAQVGSSIASSKIESTLGGYLSKIGFQTGKTTLTFQNDGSCQMVRNGRTYTGTYTYDRSSGRMTIQGALGVASLSPYVSVIGSEMYMMFDADKLLTVLNAAGSITKSGTITSILSNYNGVQLGWTMTKM